ncbi:unnamed protein product [Mytilus edulis]|uniref:TRC8-like N-terminal domain-containing protein n=1 Tax=Mytilus edulis TaxID=6550 RepID=A0A8S3RQP3_MYTED|nr:unnamed protein product [Mytilus edulis]
MRDHGSTIVGTLQRVPLLFLMDALLRMYATQMISTSVLYMYLAIAVFLLLLTKEQLGKIYKTIQSYHSDAKFHGMMMCFGIFLVASTVLEEVHKIADSFLLELGASGGGIVKKTCKAVIIIIVLIICPIWVVMKFHEIGFDLGIIWFLVATASWISVCIDSVGSLSVYLLLVLDTLNPEPIEHLDEIMYGIRAAIGIVHTGFGLLQICFLTWNITTIQWSWFSCIILAILVYYTYERVTNGWNEFQRRRTAVHRLSFLLNATQEQLLVSTMSVPSAFVI